MHLDLEWINLVDPVHTSIDRINVDLVNYKFFKSREHVSSFIHSIIHSSNNYIL